jgi:hypothetical protein
MAIATLSAPTRARFGARLKSPAPTPLAPALDHEGVDGIALGD